MTRQENKTKHTKQWLGLVTTAGITVGDHFIVRASAPKVKPAQPQNHYTLDVDDGIPTGQLTRISQIFRNSISPFGSGGCDGVGRGSAKHRGSSHTGVKP